MLKTTGLYPPVRVDAAAVSAAGSAGGVLLIKTAAITGLDTELVQGLGRWTKPTATHRPGKVLTDVAISLALGGECLPDAGLLRAEPGMFGSVGSEATISRTITALAKDADRVLKAINGARATARARAWELAGDGAPKPRDRRGPPVDRGPGRHPAHLAQREGTRGADA